MARTALERQESSLFRIVYEVGQKRHLDHYVFLTPLQLGHFNDRFIRKLNVTLVGSL